MFDRWLNKADPSTIKGKLLVGYRGCFVCPEDGEPIDAGHHGWFNGSVKIGLRPNIDILPDVSGYDSSELYEAPGLKTMSGELRDVFSSRNQRTVNRHFKWMADYGVDGAFLQKPIVGMNHSGVLGRIRKAAEKSSRVFAIMYDVSGVKSGEIEQIVLDTYAFESPNYLKEKGNPVVALSGFQFGSGHTPNFVRSIASRIRTICSDSVYLIARVPADWRTPTDDQARNQEFVDVCFRWFNAISPWTVGAYNCIKWADKFANETIAGDTKLIDERKRKCLKGELDYIPVVFPGWSGHNSSDGKRRFDLGRVRRDGGEFLWRQIFNARKHGAKTIFVATWDGYDDGTALLPVVTDKEQLPLPVVATHQEELSLPVIITRQDQVPMHIVVVPEGQMTLHIFVSADKHKPPLPGVIDEQQDQFWDDEPYHINTVIITDRDRFPPSIVDRNLEPLPFIIAHKGQPPPPAATYSGEELPVYFIDQDRLSLSVHARYEFLAPDTSTHLPPDWYMRICGTAAKSLRDGRKPLEAFPSKELEDYQGRTSFFSWLSNLFGPIIAYLQVR